MSNQDSRIREGVQAALAREAALGPEYITVLVEDGIVTLGGWVEEPEQRDRAAALARAVAGVKEVVNSVRIGSAQRGAGRAWDALTGHDIDEAHQKIQRSLHHGESDSGTS